MSILGSVIRIGEAVCSEPREEPLGSKRKTVRSVIVNDASTFVIPDVRRSPRPTAGGWDNEAEIPSA